jgi:hypothetical protein
MAGPAVGSRVTDEHVRQYRMEGFFILENAISRDELRVVQDECTAHRSGANNTSQLRRAYAIQFSAEPVLDADGSLKGLAEPFLDKGIRVR